MAGVVSRFLRVFGASVANTPDGSINHETQRPTEKHIGTIMPTEFQNEPFTDFSKEENAAGDARRH